MTSALFLRMGHGSGGEPVFAMKPILPLGHFRFKIKKFVNLHTEAAMKKAPYAPPGGFDFPPGLPEG